MSMSATLISAGLPQFAPTTNHYRCDDGRFLLVTVDDADDIKNAVPILSSVPVANVVQDYTVVYLADADARLIDSDGDLLNGMTPLIQLPAGTPHAAALRAAGYELMP